MFQVKNKETGQEYTVYAVGDEYLTKFLIYEDGHWKWQTIDDFVHLLRQNLQDAEIKLIDALHIYLFQYFFNHIH